VKVLQVYKDYYPPVKGGIEGHLNLLSEGLKRRGVDVEVLVSNTRASLERVNINGIPVTKVPQVGRFASAPLNATFPFWLQRLGKDADIIHFHFPNPTAELSSLFPGLTNNVIVTYHSDIVKQKRLKEVYSPFLVRFLKKSRAIIATSSNYVHSSRVLSGFEHKCRVIPLGIDIEKFRYPQGISAEIEAIQQRYGPFILVIGRVRYYKGLHVMIEAMRRIRGRLLLIGTGPLERELRRQTRDAGLEDRVAFLGELSDPEMISYLHACDVFALPSIQRSEAFGIVQLEAMACGKPVVCTELNTGTSYVNQHGKTGLVVSPGDVEALADAVNLLMDHPAMRQAFGQAGFQRVGTHFSVEHMIEGVIALYREMLADGSREIAQGPGPPASAYGPGRKREKIRVMRIISRLNIGGPAIHVQLLSKGLDPETFESTIVTGTISPNEGDMGYLFDDFENKPIVIEDLQREISIRKDFRVFLNIFRLIRQFHPDIVHTHTAKAGSGARTTVFLCNLLGNRKIMTVHTFHGHIFRGYFNHLKSHIFVLVERVIGRMTDVIIAISESQKRELVEAYRIAPASKIKVIELGFDLDPFLTARKHRGQFRRRLGLNDETILIGIIGRLVPIKNHRMFLDAARILLNRYPGLPVKFLVVGDGELREDLKEQSRRLGIERHIVFCGWIRDVAQVYADLNILALTSINEGTPVSIIEAMASSVPVIATKVGGVQDLMGAPDCVPGQEGFSLCRRGVLCNRFDPVGFAEGIKFLIDVESDEISNRVDQARSFVIERYGRDRLIADIETLYKQLIHSAADRKSAALYLERSVPVQQ